MNTCIVSAGVGKWYPQGVARLERSLVYHGYAGDMMLYTDLPPGSPTHEQMPYGMKLAALKSAVDLGYERILWLDASIVCIRHPKDMFDAIGHDGHYLYTSGYNCAQTVSDACLRIFGITRDEAEKIPECASNVVGFDLGNPVGRDFYQRWLKASQDGSFKGSREHDNQSTDRRFLFHRQDQSAASLICHQLGIPLHNPHGLCCDYHPTMPESIIFYRQGL